jgi:hypothetical protein
MYRIPTSEQSRIPTGGSRLAVLVLGLLLALVPGQSAAQDSEQWWDPSDPRIGLGAGWLDAEEASWNMELLANVPRPEGFYDPDNVGNLNLANSDLAFQGDLVFVGNFHGFMIYDVSDPGSPRSSAPRWSVPAVRVISRSIGTSSSCRWSRPGDGSTADPRVPRAR